MRPESRDVLLTAIAKARRSIDDIRLGGIASFAEIAEREAQGERHIRLLAPLAFLSPRIIAAIGDGTTHADLTVTGPAKALPYSWAEQEPSSPRYPLHAGQRVCRGNGLRAGVRLIPERCPANRSLSAIERLSHG